MFLLVIEKELVSVATERQKEIETLQEIITSLTLQLRERDKQIEEIKPNLKGNWYMSGKEVEAMLSVYPKHYRLILILHIQHLLLREADKVYL